MSTPREIERVLEENEERLRLARIRGLELPPDFHFTLQSAKLPPGTVIPERPQFEPPQFTEEQRRRRIEAGLDPDRSMTLKELKAAGPPPERPETDPREIERARQELATASPGTFPKELAKAFAGFGVRALGNVWGERGIDVELPWIKPATDAIIQGWGLDPAEVRKDPEKMFEGQYKERGVPSGIIGTGKFILELAQKRARREAAPKTVPGQAARMAAALITGGATEEPMTVPEARGALPSLMFGAPPFTAMYGALQPSLQLNPFLARAQAIGGKPPFVPPDLRPAWPLGPPGKFSPRQVALEGYPGFPSTGLSIPRTPAARTVTEAADVGRRAAADVGEKAPIVAGPATDIPPVGAADIPTVRPAIQIGDDVVFAGPDGDITGRVVGKGVTEIEGVSRPHLSVRYEAPSGLPQQSFILEDMARPTTAPIPARGVAREVVGEVPEEAAVPSVRATALQAAKKSIASGELSDEFVFHVGSSSNAKRLVDEGLQAGGYTSSPLAEQGYGDVVYVFRKSDLPPTLNRVYEADVISHKQGFPGAKAPFFTDAQAPKPVAAFTWRELGVDIDDLSLGARAAEEGIPPEPPLSQLVSPEDLAVVRADEQARDAVMRGEIAQAFAAPGVRVVPPTPAKIVDVPADAVPVPPLGEAAPKVSHSSRTWRQLEEMSDEELVQEAIAIRKDHISGLDMEQTEFSGIYLNTEAANRYLVSARPGSKLHSADVTIKNPRIFRISTAYESYKNDFLPKGVTLGEGAFDEDALAALQQRAMAAGKPDPMVVAGRKATAQLKREGYDSVYLPEADLNEGTLVVFDQKNVRLGPGQEITKELLGSETQAARRVMALEAPEGLPTRQAVPVVPPATRPVPPTLPGVEEAATSLQTLRQELDDLTIQVEALTEVGLNIQRPSWGRGIPNQELDRAARSLGKSVYEPDWFDDIDVALKRDILKREYRRPGDETLTSMRSRLVGLRQEVKAAENQAARETAKITVPPVTVEVQTAAATKVIVEARVDRSASASGRLRPKQPSKQPPGTPTGRPTGTPPGGPDPRSVPSNDAYHPNIPTMEEVLSWNFPEDWVGTVGQRIQSIPIVGKEFIEQVNPSILAMDDSKKGIIAFQHLRDSADTATTAAMQSIVELGNPLQVDSAGKALNIVIPKGQSPYIQDILTFPGRYRLNREQLEQVAQIKKLLQKSLDMQLEEGINIRPIRNFDDPARNISLELDVGKGQYFPRVIIGRVVEGVEEEIPGGAMRGGIGAVQARAKPRPWPTARQSIEEGNNILLADPVESVWVTIAAGYRAIAEKRFADFMKKQPGIATATDLLKQRHPGVVLARENALHDERNRRFAVNIIRDAFDPEKVPSDAAMRRLGREFPDVAEAIGLVNAGRRGQPSLIGQETPMDVSSQLSLLRSQREKLEGVADASRLRVSQTGNRYRALLSEIRQEGAQVRQPAFRDIIMSREMADQIEAQLLDQPPAALRKIETFNDVLRMLETGLDPGFIFIQGGIPLMYRPQAWGKSFSITMQSLKDPAVAARYFQLPENRAVIDKMVQFSAAPLASSEYTAGVTVLGRIPVAGAAFRRGGAAFNIYLDVARIEMHKALGPLAKNADDYRQLTTTIDQMLGVMSPRQLGVTPTRRSLQGALIAFAARYRRAGAALIASLIRGGIRGHVARRALAHFFIGGAALMTGLAAVFGQTDLLDPRKGKNNIPPMYDPRYMGRFLSIRVGDSYWGIGGVSVSTVGLVASMYRGLSEDGVRGAAIEAFRRFRGLTSPFTSDVIDLATGKAGFTEEDTHTAFGITRMVAEDVLPFFAAPFAAGALEVLEKRPFADIPGVETFVGNFGGTRERDISPHEKLTMRRGDIVASGNFMTIHGLPASEWSDLNSAQQKESERTDPRMKQLNLEIEDSNYRRANNAKRERLDRERLAREDFEAKMTKNASNLTKGVEGYSKKDYDTKRKSIRTYNRAVTNTLWELRASSEARDVARIEKWVKENQTSEDAALDAFFDRRDTLFDELGVMTSAKWDTLDRKLEDWLKKTYGATVRDWVLAHKDDWILALPPLVRDLELFRARSIEAGTWFTGYRLPAHPTQYAGISEEIQEAPENLGPYLRAIEQQRRSGRRPASPLIRPPSQPLQLVHDPLTSRFAGMR